MKKIKRYLPLFVLWLSWVTLWYLVMSISNFELNITNWDILDLKFVLVMIILIPAIIFFIIKASQIIDKSLKH